MVVPTLDEAEHLPGLLDALQAQRGITLEVIVVDGGSRDATEVVARCPGVRIIRSQRGRGRQMNAGAAQSNAPHLLFLHADTGIDDTLLLADALVALRKAESDDGAVAGHFRLHFVRRSPRHTLLYRYMEEKTGTNRPQTINGDQGLLLSRDFFQALGGFDEDLPFLEDQRLAARIRAQGRWITLPGVIHTSARRFETEGGGARYTLMALTMGLYSLGLWQFFERAPGLYRSQGETAGNGRLQLSPFLRLIRELLADMPRRERLRTWLRAGRYVRSNAWQAFFFMDVLARPLLGPDRYPMLRVHDRLLTPLIHHRLMDVPVTLAVYIWMRGILTPYWRLRERRACARSR